MTVDHKQSINVQAWEKPRLLIPELAPNTPYPVDALPDIIKKPVLSYQQYGQQPLPMIASSALANLSLACQSLANVARDAYLVSPVSLYFLTVALSGERKSAADKVFSQAIRQWEQKIRKLREPALKSALTHHKTWSTERDGLLAKIRRAVMNNEDCELEKALLESMEQNEPDIPIQPSLYFEDTTHEGLSLHLAHGWPSVALWSDEGGMVLGSHSMQSNPARFAALLNGLWEGKALSTHRKSSPSFVVENRRLTVNIMMQPMLFEPMRNKKDSVIRQSGLMARCLLAYPESAMGQRFYQEPPESIEGLDAWNQRITDCLNHSGQLNQAGCIHLPILNLTHAAKKHWIRFYNALETGLHPLYGQWQNMRDLASKAAENAARLAALFHLFEGKTGDISEENMEQAIEIIHWYMTEARRLLEPPAHQPYLETSQKLLDWLLSRKNTSTSPRDMLQASPCRNRNERDKAMETLLEHNIIRIIKTGKKAEVEINPWLV